MTVQASTGAPPSNLPLSGGNSPQRPGGGIDAPDPFSANAQLPETLPAPVSPPQVAVAAPLAPPAFAKPVPPRRNRRAVALIGGGVIILLLLSAAGLVAARFFFASSAEPTPSPTAVVATIAPTISSTATPEESVAATPDAENEVLDADRDGLNFAEERFYGTEPETADTDGDSYSDGDEVRAGYDPLGPGKLDSDNDNFPDPDEREFGSDPFNPDTDGDGYNDGEEIKAGHNPLLPAPDDKL